MKFVKYENYFANSGKYDKYFAKIWQNLGKIISPNKYWMKFCERNYANLIIGRNFAQ